MKIKTNSLEPGEPKDPEGNTLFEIYRAFASESEVEAMRQHYANGIAWGEAKQMVFEHLNGILAEPREHYNELMAEPDKIDKILLMGAEKARAVSKPFLQRLRQATGIS